ncbi:hypothetical protein H4582DRAFT_1973032 [Lactarius indigo]|nr:hypothetical protein H4582DRAFT_1973032 [Lactarius indigo]
MSLNDGWLTIYQASITVVNLFMGVEVPLLFFIKSDSNFRESIGSAPRQALLTLAYSGLFFSLSAAQGYKARSMLTWVELHWMLSLIGATILPIAQVLLYVWLEESNSVRIAVSVITMFAALPMVFFIPLPSSKGKRHSTFST